MLRGLTGKERKRKINCKKGMPCKDCEELVGEFGTEKINDVIAILGPTAAATEVRSFIVQGGLREGC